MATSQQGYQCEFIDSVPEDLYCKKCALVARRLTVAMCCGESFCHDCLVESRQQDKSCPACGEKNFTTFEQIKSQKRINCLQVYCSVKERGCGWSGSLKQLDSHLDPDLDNCQYVDTKCPLNCPMAVPKNKVEQHVDKECVKRAFTCQHCDFKATYEEVVDTHLTECKYVPLQCPNMCGVTCEREVMEDHMKICRLQNIACEFGNVGCNDWFTREDEEKHIRQNHHKHLTLTASVAVKTKEQLQQNIKKLEEKIEEEQYKVRKHENKQVTLRHLILEQEKKMEEQEKKMKEQQKKLQNQDNELKDQGKKIEEQSSRILTLEQLLKEVVDKSIQNGERLSEMFSALFLNRKFNIENFSDIQAKSGKWKSPAMYTHMHGYRFSIEVKPDDCYWDKEKCMKVVLWILPGEFDDQLKWPVHLKYTLELVNQQGGDNRRFHQDQWRCTKPTARNVRSIAHYTKNSTLLNFLQNDTLHLHMSELQVLELDNNNY